MITGKHSFLLTMLCIMVFIGLAGCGGGSKGSHDIGSNESSSTSNNENGSSTDTNSSTSLPKWRILVPAYFYPTGGGPWDQLATESGRCEGLIWAIANVNNGPGTSVDQSYINAINKLRNNSGHCIGYVHTSYGSRSINTVEGEIDQWYQWYPIDGIFLDEMANTGDSTTVSYYQQLYRYIKAKSSTALVVGNPGTDTSENYITSGNQRSSDVFCIFESSGDHLDQSPPAESWYHNYDRSNFYILIYNVAAADWQTKVSRAYSLNAGWIYITNDQLNNPWDTLPPYFSDLCSFVRNM